MTIMLHCLATSLLWLLARRQERHLACNPPLAIHKSSPLEAFGVPGLTWNKGGSILQTSVGFRSSSQSSAVSTQVTKVINPSVGCQYLPPRPCLRTQPPGITTHWSLPNYTAWQQRHVCKQLAQGCIRQRGGRDSNLRPVDRKSGSLTTRPPSHTWNNLLSHSTRINFSPTEWEKNCTPNSDFTS